MPKNPLAEVFGFPVNNMSADAQTHRAHHYCPYHNSSGINCTKISATDPIGVCSIFEGNNVVATCPVRFREAFKIVADASAFFFPNKKVIALTEARLKDKQGNAAGNIDIVIAALNEKNEVVDFGAVEVQAVYITGNVRNAFKKYMENPSTNAGMEWPRKNYPKPDYLSSSRKRLAPQLIYKGGILHTWHKKMAVIVDESFYNQLPKLKKVEKRKADIAWMVYGFRQDKVTNRFILEHKETRFTQFEDALLTLTTPLIGEVKDFMAYLQDRVRTKRYTDLPPASPLPPDVEPLLGIENKE